MSITQTVEVPASHRLLIDVPRDIPAGRTILTFTPDPCRSPAPDDLGRGIDGECPLDHTPNAVTVAAIREGRAMMRGEIPAKWYNSAEEMWADLRK